MRRPRNVSRPKNGEPCYYCGRQATQVDHVIPQSMLRQLAMSTEPITMEIIKHRALTVHSCGECNTLLSNIYLESLQAKKKYLKTKLRKRYKKVLEMPRWDQDEVEELGYNLRTFVQGSIDQKELVLERLRW